jgi:MraZ protein
VEYSGAQWQGWEAGSTWGSLDAGGCAPMFLGTHTPRLDDKGRLILPAKFRDELAGGVVITKGQERCLYVFPTAEFQRIAGQLREAPMTNKAARAYSRVFFASAHDEVPDKQGRVTIPGHLREYGALDRELVVIGASSRVEIWDKQAWETYLADSEDEFSEIEEGVLPGGL